MVPLQAAYWSQHYCNSGQTVLEKGKTNHSLRATQLFDAGVPQRIIQERTGHKSVLSLRTYERISNHQNQAVSNILTSSTSGSFQEEVATVKAASIKIDTGDLDAAIAKDLALFDLIPMDFLQ